MMVANRPLQVTCVMQPDGCMMGFSWHCLPEYHDPRIVSASRLTVTCTREVG
jgi:hypothetical protein